MDDMNRGFWDQLAGSWKQVMGHVRTQWGKLTDDDLEEIRGRRDVLLGKIQERYGVTRQEAERQVDDWSHRMR